jgi:hypothetical protein
MREPWRSEASDHRSQVNPAPKATKSTVEPSLMRPCAIASSKAMGMDAAEVLPKRSTFTNTLSMEMPACFAVASMMRTLA